MTKYLYEPPPQMSSPDGLALAEFLQRQLFALSDAVDHINDFEDAEPFEGKPQDGMLRWFVGGAPGNSSGPGFYYYYDGSWSYIGGAEVVTYGAVIPGTGNVWDDVNAYDFTGHPYASGSCLAILPNAIVTFGHNGISYLYEGPRDVCIGLGGDYATVQDDYAPLGTGDHSILINRDAADAHPMSAVTGLMADQTRQDEDLTAHKSAAPAHTMTQIEGLNADQARQDTNHSNHLADLNNPHQVRHDQLPDVDPDPTNPHPQYDRAHVGLLMGGTVNNFTLNTTDSKLVNYSLHAQYNWPDDDDVNPVAGEITIPEDGVYQFTAHILGDQGNDNKEEWIELKINVAGGPDPGRERIDILEVATDKTTGRCLQATWTRGAYVGEVYSLWMWASTGLGTFAVEAVTFEAIKQADIGELE